MAQLIQNGDVLSGTSNDSANILYSEPDGSSKNVQEKIGEIENGLINSITVLKKKIDASDITLVANGGVDHINIISKMGISNEYVILGYPQIDIWGYGHIVIPVPLGNNIRLVNVGDTSVTLTTVDVWVTLKKI